jgi:lytic murein transglycosylase
MRTWLSWRKLRVAAMLCASLATLAQDSVDTGDGESLAACVAALRRELPQHPELRADAFDTFTSTAKDMRPTIVAATAAQPEFQLPIWDYLVRRFDAQRVADGKALLGSEAQALQRIAQRHGVDGATVVSVFGIETDYGRAGGKYPVLDATLSRACLNLNSAERKRHFFSALWLLQQGLVAPEDFRGSWAGAFGLTQFMPGTVVKLMDDGDGSGQVDIVHSVPDALATTARYLTDLGWQSGLPWGLEVDVPPALRVPEVIALESDHGCLAPAAPAAKCRSVEQWTAGGIKRVDGSPLVSPSLPANTRTALLMPAGPDGPAWLITSNYQALWRYNRADAYALAIGLLGNALRDEPAQVKPWPTDDPGVSRAELKELQTLLAARGHCEVRPDGFEGPLTTAAIRDEEQRHGLPESGRAASRILKALRSDVSEGKTPECAASAPAR